MILLDGEWTSSYHYKCYDKPNTIKSTVTAAQQICLGTITGEDNSDCDWTGLREDIDDHIREAHRLLIYNSVDGTFNLSASAMVDYKYILFDDRLFCVLIHTDPLRTSCLQKVFTSFFHIFSITCEGENGYAYNVKIEGQDDTFEGFVGRMITSHTNVKDMASKFFLKLFT
jgi:hypothetical protein